MGAAFASIPIQRGSRDSHAGSAVRLNPTVRMRRIYDIFWQNIFATKTPKYKDKLGWGIICF
jgi:hypothetical protein